MRSSSLNQARTVNKFIVLAARRSGTTLLIDYLNSHPEVECVKRAFGLEKKIVNPTPDNHSGGFYLYRTKNLINRVRFFVQRSALIGSYLDEDVFLPRQHYTAAGFRLIYEMSSKYPVIADWARENEVRIVHLVRRNLLKTYVSTVSAPVHKMRHPREGATITTAKIRIDPRDLLESLNQRVWDIDLRRQKFSACEFHELSYEDLVSNKDEVLGKVQTFLGIDRPAELTSDLVKINPESLSGVIENFDEIADVLSGTPYEKFLD